MNHFIFGHSDNRQEYSHKLKKWIACLLNTPTNKIVYFPLIKVTVVQKREYSLTDKFLEINYYVEDKQMKGYLSDETCCVLTKPKQDDEKLIWRFTLDSSSLKVLVDRSLRSLVNITGNKNKDANNIISKKRWSKGLYIFSYAYSYGYFDEEKNSIDYYSVAKDFSLIGLSVFKTIFTNHI